MGLGFDDLNPVNLINEVIGVDVGDAWDSFTGKDQQRSANEANLASAREQMAFQERMSSTAHQREVKDLEAAGINPMLSAKLGGASSPAGAQAIQHPVPSGTNKFVSTALDMANFAKDQRVASQSIRESESRAASNTANALNTAVNTERGKQEVEIGRGEVVKGRTKGRIYEGLERFINRMLQRFNSTAKEGPVLKKEADRTRNGPIKFRKWDIHPKFDTEGR